MEHLGIDVHQKYSEICWLSEEGEVKLRRPPLEVPPE